MEQKVIQLPIMSVVVGSSLKFKGIREPGQSNNGPLKVNAWTQTTGSDFTYLSEIENRETQSQKEKELEEKIKALEIELKAHTDLLAQIHVTTARSTALLSNQQPQQSQQHNINNNNNSSSSNFISSSRTQQLSPKIVNAINPIQNVNCSPKESIKYRIVAECTGNHNGEPIEVQLAEDDGALNLNSSSDSGRLEICLTPEENTKIKTEYQSGNNSMTIHNQAQPTTQSTTQLINTIPSEHHIIKRQKRKSEQFVTKYESPGGSSLLKIPKVQITNMQTTQTTQMPNINPTPTNNCNPDCDLEMQSIGPNNTRIPAKIYENINWTSASIATRRLLMTLFDRKVLATHSMTGKPSPAFKDHNKPIKQMLDPLIIADIIFVVTRKCQVSDKEVRNVITTKCADENKMMKLQMNKRMSMPATHKENRGS